MYSHSFHAKLIWYEEGEKKKAWISPCADIALAGTAAMSQMCAERRAEIAKETEAAHSSRKLTIARLMVMKENRERRFSPCPLSSVSQVFALMWTPQMSLLLCCGAEAPAGRAQGFPPGCEKQYCQEQSASIRRYQTLPSVCEAAWSWQKCAWCHKKVK